MRSKRIYANKSAQNPSAGSNDSEGCRLLIWATMHGQSCVALGNWAKSAATPLYCASALQYPGMKGREPKPGGRPCEAFDGLVFAASGTRPNYEIVFHSFAPPDRLQARPVRRATGASKGLAAEGRVRLSAAWGYGAHGFCNAGSINSAASASTSLPACFLDSEVMYACSAHAGKLVRGQVGKPVACLGVQGQGLAGPSYCHVEQVDLLHHFIGQRLTCVVNEEFLDLL